MVFILGGGWWVALDTVCHKMNDAQQLKEEEEFILIVVASVGHLVANSCKNLT